jgi:hypothetical protein
LPQTNALRLETFVEKCDLPAVDYLSMLALKASATAIGRKTDAWRSALEQTDYC